MRSQHAGTAAACLGLRRTLGQSLARHSVCVQLINDTSARTLAQPPPLPPLPAATHGRLILSDTFTVSTCAVTPATAAPRVGRQREPVTPALKHARSRCAPTVHLMSSAQVKHSVRSGCADAAGLSGRGGAADRGMWRARCKQQIADHVAGVWAD